MSATSRIKNLSARGADGYFMRGQSLLSYGSKPPATTSSPIGNISCAYVSER